MNNRMISALALCFGVAVTGCTTDKVEGVSEYPVLTKPFYSSTLQDEFYDTPVLVTNDRYGTHLVISTDLLFTDPGKSIINPALYPTLNHVIKVVNRYPTRKITVAGHTDDILTVVQQQEISEQYARSIANYLLSQGVVGNRITAVRGDAGRYPISENSHYQGRADNRRIEIILHAQIE